MAVPLMFQPLVKYAQFEGRSRRSEFWLWFLFRFLLGQLMGAIAFAIIGPFFMPFGMAGDANAHPEVIMREYMMPWFRVFPFFSVIGLALFIPTLAVAVRRLHDINRSGWWVILPYVVGIIGLIAFFVVTGMSLFGLISAHPNGDIPDMDGLKAVFQILGSLFLFACLPPLVAWIVMLVFFVTEGTKGPNRFGLDPKGATDVF